MSTLDIFDVLGPPSSPFVLAAPWLACPARDRLSAVPLLDAWAELRPDGPGGFASWETDDFPVVPDGWNAGAFAESPDPLVEFSVFVGADRTGVEISDLVSVLTASAFESTSSFVGFAVMSAATTELGAGDDDVTTPVFAGAGLISR